MAADQLTSFEQLLLGLLCMSPASGYDLKRTFATTPAGVYQPSSGALYPALRRLEARALIQAKPPDSATRSARRRRVYEPTEAGRTVHLAWLRTPVEPATVARDLGLHLMRFVMMEPVFSPDDVLSFLSSLKDALTASLAQLERYVAAPAQPFGRHPRLALDHGLAIHRATLRWTKDTMAALRSPGQPSAGKPPA
jgi:DNA-binding PadR family transcriptional regulator